MRRMVFESEDNGSCPAAEVLGAIPRPGRVYELVWILCSLLRAYEGGMHGSEHGIYRDLHSLSSLLRCVWRKSDNDRFSTRS